MERGSKRKAAAAAASPTLNLRPPKRQKPLDNNASTAKNGKSAQSTTTQTGIRFLEQLRRTTDKNGRPIADAFLHLPDRDLYADYYERTPLPVAIETIEDKLLNNEYPTLTSLESDVKRMIANAKVYNEPKSEVYEDAERVRKNAYNFMKLANPAYKDQDYKAFPTPNPDTHTKGQTLRLPNAKARANTAARAPKREASSPRGHTSAPESSKGTPTVDEKEATGDETFEGLEFQNAQRKIINEMIEHKDEDTGELNFYIFTNLPNREMRDYYAVIKEPRCLKGVMKRVNGWHGRTEQTHVTDFKSWDAFEEEVAKIWQNAHHYNEDGSQIYELADSFEKYFKERLAEAKKWVAQPPQVNIKLKMPIAGSTNGTPVEKKGMTIRMNPEKLNKDSPAPPGAQNSTSLETADLRRNTTAGQPNAASQQMNAQPLPNGLPSATSQSSTGRPGTGNSGSGPATSIKSEQHNGMAPPAQPGFTAPYNTSLPPQSMRPPSGSPYPTPHQTNQPAAPYVPPQQFDSKWRQVGREPSLSYLGVSTHPDLQLPRPLNLAIPPHAKLAYQSVTANLPATHKVLRIRPELAQSLQGPMGRPYKVFLTVNGVRIQQRHDPPLMNGANGPRSNGPSFDVKLMPGMNRLEFECAAASGNRGINGGRAEVELERVCVYANLMKA